MQCIRTCSTCGASFEIDTNKKGQTSRRYCSDACSQKARKTKQVAYVAKCYARHHEQYLAYNTKYAKAHREAINAQARLRGRAERAAQGIKPRWVARVEYRKGAAALRPDPYIYEGLLGGYRDNEDDLLEEMDPDLYLDGD